MRATKLTPIKKAVTKKTPIKKSTPESSLEVIRNSSRQTPTVSPEILSQIRQTPTEKKPDVNLLNQILGRVTPTAIPLPKTKTTTTPSFNFGGPRISPSTPLNYSKKGSEITLGDGSKFTLPKGSTFLPPKPNKYGSPEGRGLEAYDREKHGKKKSEKKARKESDIFGERLPYMAGVKAKMEEIDKSLFDYENKIKDWEKNRPKMSDVQLNSEEKFYFDKMGELKKTKKDYQDFLDGKEVGFFKNLWKDKGQAVPIVNTINDISNIVEISKIIKKQERNEELNINEEIELHKFTLNQLPRESFGGQIGSMLPETVGFGLEFAASGGTVSSLKGGGSYAAKKAIEETMKRKILNFSKEKALQTAFMPSTYENIVMKKMEPEVLMEIDSNDDVYLKLESNQKGWGEAIARGYLGSYVETLSESAGKLLEPFTKSMKINIGQTEVMDGVKRRLLGQWANKYSNAAEAIDKIKKGTGWNGVLEEIFEEEIAEPVQAKIDERKYYNPITTKEGRDRLAVEAAGIALMGVLGKSPQIAESIGNLGSELKNDTRGTVPADFGVGDIMGKKQDIQSEPLGESTLNSPSSKNVPVASTDSVAQDLSTQENEVGQIAFDQTISNGGVTIKLDNKAIPKKGFVVSPYKQSEKIIPIENFTKEEVVNYIKESVNLKNDSHYLGLWKDPQSGKVYLDTVVLKENKEDAHNLAKQNEQLAFYDLERGETINLERGETLQTNPSSGSTNIDGREDGGISQPTQKSVEQNPYSQFKVNEEGLRPIQGAQIEQAKQSGNSLLPEKYRQFAPKKQNNSIQEKYGQFLKKQPLSQEIQEAQFSEKEIMKVESMKAKIQDFDGADLKLFSQIRRMKESGKYSDGDIETMRRDHPKLIEKVIERFNEVKQGEISDVEVFDEILELPSKNDVQRAEREKISNSFKSVERGGITVKEKNERIKEVKSEIVKYAKKNLNLYERGKLLSIVKNARTIKDFGDAIGRIDQLQKDNSRRELMDYIKKQIKSTKVKSQSGRPIGKYGAKAQKTLDIIRDTVEMTQETADAKIQENLNKYVDKILPPESVLENLLLSEYAGLSNKSFEQLQKLSTEIKDLKDTGQTERLLKVFNAQTEIQRGKDLLFEVVGEASVETKLYGAQVRTVKQWLANHNITNWLMAWKDLLDILAGKEKGTEAFQSSIYDRFNTRRETAKMKEISEQYYKKLNDSLYSIYNFKSSRQLNKKLKEDHIEGGIGKDGNFIQVKTFKKNNLPKFKNAMGIEVEMKYTKAEARKLWMEMQDLTLQETFDQGMGFTQEMKSALNKFLSKEDKQFAKKQIEIYQGLYKELNQVYEEMNGVSLPNNPNYSPIRRLNFNQENMDGFGDFMQEFNQRASVNKGGLKSRVKNILPLKKQSDLLTFSSHISEMSHYISFAKKTRELSQVFNDTDVKLSIEENYGKQMNYFINKFVERFMTNGKVQGFRIRMIDKLRGNIIQSTLFIKPAILIKQLTSTPAYLENVPAKDFLVGVLDFWSRPMKNYKTLMEKSSMFRARGMEFERDIKEAANSDALVKFRKTPNLKNWLGVNIQIGDKGAVAIGGWADYQFHKKKYLKQGMDPILADKKAIEAFEDHTLSAQQSSDIEDMNFAQKSGNSILDLFTTYMTSPFQYFQKEVGYMRNIILGRGNQRRNVRNLMLYHFALPLIFQGVSSLFGFSDDDKNEYLRTLILGNLNSYLILGDMAEGLVRRALDLPTFSDELVISKLDDYFDDTLKLFSKDGVGSEEFLEGVEGLADFLGAITGAPAPQIHDEISAIFKINDGKTKAGIAQLMGWTPYIVDSRFKEEAPKEEATAEQEYLKQKLNESKDEKVILKEQALKKFQELSQLPPDEANKKAEEIYNKNPEMFKEIQSLKQDEKDRLNETEKLIKKLGVENRARAEYVYQKTDEMKTSEEKNAYLEDLYNKKVITDKVLKQIKEIKDEGGLKSSENLTENMRKEDYLKNRTKGELFKDYKKAWGVDKANTINALFTKEELGMVEGNAVQLKRYFGEEWDDMDKGSEGKRKEMMEDMGLDWSDRSDWSLEHILPVAAGGGNREKNLKIVSREEHDSYTPVDRKMWQKIKDEKITKKEAKKIAIDLKIDKTITVSEALKKLDEY